MNLVTSISFFKERIKLRFHHIGLEVEDLVEAISFYTKYFGFSLEKQLKLLDEDIVFLVSDHMRLELVTNPEEKGELHICYEVSNIEETMKEMGHNQILEGPYLLENGWKTVFYEGPNKVNIEFLQIKQHAETNF